MSDLDRGDLIQQEVNPELFNRLYEEAIRGSSSGSDGELSGIANRQRARAISTTSKGGDGSSPPISRSGSMPEDLLAAAVANAFQEGKTGL